jgi:hypothetical protein
MRFDMALVFLWLRYGKMSLLGLPIIDFAALVWSSSTTCTKGLWTYPGWVRMKSQPSQM